MQNLPITALQAAAPAPQTTSADSNTAQPSEAFSNVLARQRSGESTPASTGAEDSKPAAPAAGAKAPTAKAHAATANAAKANASANSAGTNASAVSASEQPGDPQAPAPDAAALSVSAIPAGALLASAAANGVASNEQGKIAKADPLAPAPDAVPTLPAEMLAVLAPAPIATNGIATTGKKELPAEVAPSAKNTQPADALATVVSAPATPLETSAGVRPQAAAKDAAGVGMGVTSPAGQPKPLLRAQDIASPSRMHDAATAPAPAAAQGNAFAAALDTLGKNGALSARADHTAEISVQAAQHDAATNVTMLTQGIASPVAATPNAPVQAAVSVPVAHQAWGEEFGQKITWLATQNTQNAELHLNPPQLGPLDVVLNVSGDQATALFTSPHAAVRDAIEQALPKLREMLADNGITLGNATVSDQSPKEQQAWLADQQQNGRGNFSGRAGDAATMGPGALATGSTTLPLRRHQGMVDTFA